MADGETTRVAVLDLGTNTTRLLVADVADGRMAVVARRTEITRLGEGVDTAGRLAEGAIARVTAVLDVYRRAIDEAGVDVVTAVATSAVRDAADGPEFLRGLRERLGIEVTTISGATEARLTFLGATSGGPPAAPDGEVLVLDIGGGSTEFVVGRPAGDPEFDVSTAAGSVRQTERHLHGDPPTPEQLRELRQEVRGIAESGVPAEVRARVVSGIAVAGTATSFAAISQRLEPYDPDRVHGFELTREEAGRILDSLAAMPLEERREVAGLHPDRAPTIVAGGAILVEAMAAFGLDSMVVSEADLLHGAALQAALRVSETGRKPLS